MNPKTKMDHLREHLRSGRSITQLEALGVYGIFRLAARILDLKNKGWKIVTEMKRDPNGSQYACYKLAETVATKDGLSLPPRYRREVVR